MVGVAYLAAAGAPIAGVTEIAGQDVLGAEAIGRYVGESNANNHNSHVRSCASDWETNVRAGQIVVNDCLYTLRYRQKTPSPTSDAYLAEHIMSPAEIEDRKDTYGNRGRILGGAAGIALGGAAAFLLALRRKFNNERGPLDSSNSGASSPPKPDDPAFGFAVQ